MHVLFGGIDGICFRGTAPLGDSGMTCVRVCKVLLGETDLSRAKLTEEAEEGEAPYRLARVGERDLWTPKLKAEEGEEWEKCLVGERDL